MSSWNPGTVRTGQQAGIEANSTLITNNGQGATQLECLTHELQSPNLERVDILCSYVKQTGLGHLWPFFTAIKHHGIPVQLMATTQHQITDADAIAELANLSNFTIKIMTRMSPTFHAKSWHFWKRCDMHSQVCRCQDVCIVGSSNMSDSALVGGMEWNVRIQGHESTLQTFIQTFDQYWNSGLFETYGESLAYQDLQRYCNKNLQLGCDDPNCTQCAHHRQHITLKRNTKRIARDRPKPSATSSSLMSSQTPEMRKAFHLSVASPPPSPVDQYQEPDWHDALRLGVSYQDRVKDLMGSTLLHSAAAGGVRLDVVQELLSLGADPDIADDRGNIPLHCVAHSGGFNDRNTMEMISILRRVTKEPRVQNIFGFRPDDYIAATSRSVEDYLHGRVAFDLEPATVLQKAPDYIDHARWLHDAGAVFGHHEISFDGSEEGMDKSRAHLWRLVSTLASGLDSDGEYEEGPYWDGWDNWIKKH